ncbi:Werner Syndrome-like exonuclease, partial [Bienertia sinuspersici]
VDSITQWVTKTLSLHKGKKVIVGLDIEWKPNRTKYMNNKAATLHLCINTECLIIQLIYLNTIPRSLKDFLSTKLYDNVTFVGVEIESDVAKLRREYGLKCGQMKDLYKRVGLNRQKIGLKNLAWEVVGLVMSKPKHVTMSNWEVRVLSEEQIEYV